MLRRKRLGAVTSCKLVPLTASVAHRDRAPSTNSISYRHRSWQAGYQELCICLSYIMCTRRIQSNAIEWPSLSCLCVEGGLDNLQQVTWTNKQTVELSRRFYSYFFMSSLPFSGDLCVLSVSIPVDDKHNAVTLQRNFGNTIIEHILAVRVFV